MKTEIHPEYITARIVCACGRVTETRGTVEEYHVDICSHCHPFFTGKQKLVDTAGRVERFLAKYGEGEEDLEEAAAAAAERAAGSEKLEMEAEEPEAGEEPEDEPATGAGSAPRDAAAGTEEEMERAPPE